MATLILPVNNYYLHASGYFHRPWYSKPKGFNAILFIVLSICNLLFVSPISSHQADTSIYSEEEYNPTSHKISTYIQASNRRIDLEVVKRITRSVISASEQYQLSPGLLLAVIKHESNFDPLAVSPKGALGLMQVIPSWHTDKIYALKRDKPSNLQDPDFNIHLGAWILRSYIDQHKTV